VRYRTIWISDVHLGTRQCDAGALLAFLESHDSDDLYLVGDIIDFWSLRRQPYWPQSHSDVIRKVLSKARAGTIVTLIPGNHDEYLRRFSDLQLGNIMITREAVHRTANGRLLPMKPVVEFVTAFETALAREAGRRGLAGVVCGHIHRPALREIGPIVYANSGDWVENGTAVVEHMDGELELVFPRAPARVTTATAGATR
jgi:UDP-2,3-diacylglucosamine pyrophosphatase LpxH